jgi:hypothetical protein
MKTMPSALAFRPARKNLRFTAAILLASLAGGCTQREYVYVTDSGHFVLNEDEIAVQFPDLTLPMDASNVASGTWSAPISAITHTDPVQLALIGRTATNNQNIIHQWTQVSQTESLPTVSANGPVSFRIRSDAAVLQFEGVINGQRASGTVQLTLDPAYRQAIESLTGDRIIVEQAISLASRPVPLDYVRTLHDAGYNFHLGDYQRLIVSSVATDYAVALRQAGYQFSADDLIRLHRAGVEANYAGTMRPLGLGLNADELIRLRRAGIEPDFAAAMHPFAFGQNPDDLIRLRRSGVEPAYAAGLHAFAFGQNADELIRARRSGIEVAFAQGMADAGYTFSLDDLIRLRRSGVEPNYAAPLWKAGYRFNADALINLRRAGVTTDYAILLAGHSLLTADEIIQLSRRGIDAQTIQKLRN